MTDPRTDPQTLWKEQPMSTQILSPEMLEVRSRRLDSRIESRNRWEYIAGGLVIVASVAIASITVVSSSGSVVALAIAAGFILLGLGALIAMLQLHRRTGHAPQITGALSTLATYRAELVRQRDALRSVFLWYIAPFLPGFGLIYGATLVDTGFVLPVLLPAVVTAIFLFWVVAANRRAARRIDREIADIDHMTVERH